MAKKALCDTNQCWRLQKNPGYSKWTSHPSNGNEVLQLYSPNGYTTQITAGCLQDYQRAQYLYSFSWGTEHMQLAEKFWEFTAFRNCTKYYCEDTQHTPIQYGIHTTAARWNMLDRYYINWALPKTISFTHSTRAAISRCVLSSSLEGLPSC